MFSDEFACFAAISSEAIISSDAEVAEEAEESPPYDVRSVLRASAGARCSETHALMAANKPQGPLPEK